ncbi:MAG: SDR family oxidoreductase [Magnetococcales bacterium]|nr:SDR family oxidoreductase [Magnetococcales bacterium]
MRKILIIGATSAIAQAVAHRYAQQGHALFLTGRDPERVATIAADLRVRGAVQVESATLDANQIETHQTVLDHAITAMGSIDTVLIAHGVLNDQQTCQASVEDTLDAFQTNALSAIALLTLLANYMEHNAIKGTLAVISSVAGDRGRQSNYVYGAAKAAKSTFLAGLRNRLHSAGIHVLTIKPGFVDTPMTAHLKKGLLWAQPDDVAAGIVKSIEKRRDCVYLPGFWWLIMTIIRAIPESLFKRLTL